MQQGFCGGGVAKAGIGQAEKQAAEITKCAVEGRVHRFGLLELAFITARLFPVGNVDGIAGFAIEQA